MLATEEYSVLFGDGHQMFIGFVSRVLEGELETAKQTDAGFTTWFGTEREFALDLRGKADDRILLATTQSWR